MESGREQEGSNPTSKMGGLLHQISSAHANAPGEPLQGYYKNDVSRHDASYAISTIPEGSVVKAGSMPLSTQSRDESSQKAEKLGGGGSPPPHSSAATTGTTTTPTSVGGNSDGTTVSVSTGTTPASPEPNMRHDGFNQTTAPSQSRAARAEQQPWSENFEGTMSSSKYTATSSTQSAPTSQEGSFSNSPSLGPMSGRYSAAAYPSAIKLLVSNNVAGYIIGRSGQTVSELQAQSSTRIKLSQTGDYFPGTQDRVCLVQGQIENVKLATRMLLERLYMLQEQQNSQGFAWQPRPPESGAANPFEFVVRLLVPASSCGMIIGKSGSNIKHMEEATGVTSVRLSPKEGIITDPSYPPTAAAAALVAATSERVVTLSGPTLESCVQCTFIILDGMTLHPDICRYSNMTTSYSRVLPTAAAATTGVSPYNTGLGANTSVRGPLRTLPNTGRMQGVTEGSSLWEPLQQHQPPSLERRVSSSPDLASPHLFLEGSMMAPISPHFPHSGESANLPPGMGMTYSPNDAPPSFPQPSPPPSCPSPLLYLMGGMPPPPPQPSHEMPRLAGCSSAPDLIAMVPQDSLAAFDRNNNYLLSPAQGSSSHMTLAGSVSPGFLTQPPLPNNPGATTVPNMGDNTVNSHNSPVGGFMGQVLVPDAFIGLILGRGGRTLHELQIQSGTRIRISQRGEYVPGSRDRIVTIKGTTAQSIHLAQVLIHQRMAVLPLPTPAATASLRSGFEVQHQHQQHGGYASFATSTDGGGSSGNMMMMMSMGLSGHQASPSDVTEIRHTPSQQPPSSQSQQPHSSS